MRTRRPHQTLPRELDPAHAAQTSGHRKALSQASSPVENLSGLTPHQIQVLTMQQRIGNRQVVARLKNSTPTVSRYRQKPARSSQATAGSVQRYTVLDQQSAGGQAQYTTNRPGAAPLFPSQKQAPEWVEDPATQGTFQQQVLETSAVNPQLRVSDDGNMAAQYLTQAQNEARAFYTTDEILQASNRQLEDVQSNARLAIASGNTIKVPTNPAGVIGPGTARRELKQVKPTSPTNTDVQNTVDANECSLVAQKIMGQQGSQSGVGVFESGGQKSEKYFEFGNTASSEEASPDTFAAEVADRTVGRGVNEMGAVTGFDKTVNPGLKQHFLDTHRAAIAAGRIARPDPASDWYAYADTPDDARTEIDLRLTNGERLRVSEIEGIVMRYAKAQGVVSYGRMTGGARDTRAGQTGVNQFALPEVGESYGAFTLGTTGVVPFNGAQPIPGGMDLSAESHTQRTELNRLMDPNNAALEEQVDGLLKGSHAIFTNMQAGLWTWHYAAVVAKSGSDRVTLENYNRQTADKKAEAANWTDLWNRLSVTYNAYRDATINGKATDREKVTALKQKLVAQVGPLAGALNQIKFKQPDTRMNDRWYFQMYGPATKAGPGGLADQSFHTEWTQAGGFVNPITIRTAAEADDPYKAQMSAKLTGVLAPNDPLFATLPNLYQTALTQATTNINQATTRTTVAQEYRAALANLLPREKYEVLGAKARQIAQGAGVYNPALDISQVGNAGQVLATIDAWIRLAQTYWANKGFGGRAKAVFTTGPRALYRVNKALGQLQTIRQLVVQLDAATQRELAVAVAAPTDTF